MIRHPLIPKVLRSFSAIKLPLNMGNAVSAEEREEFQMKEKVRYPNL